MAPLMTAWDRGPGGCVGGAIALSLICAAPVSFDFFCPRNGDAACTVSRTVGIVY